MSAKIHSFIIITSGEGKPGEYTFKHLFTTRDDKEAGELTAELLARDAGFKRANRARNVREVVVVHVDPDEHKKFLTTPGRNGLTSKEVRRGQSFVSAAAASGQLGLRHNEVAISLSRCSQTGEKTATLRGVTLAYKDDVK